MIDFPNDPRGRELMLMVERLKYERWLGTAVDDLLEREFNRVVDLMLSSRYRDLTQFQKQRLGQLAREIQQRYTAGYGDVVALHVKEMKGYAALEAELSRETVRAVLIKAGVTDITAVVGDFGPFLPRNYLASIARLPIQGLNISDWFDAQARTMTLETRRLLQQGLIDGKSPLEIARRIVAPATTDGPVLVRRARNEARMISRTTVNAVQNDAQMASLSALSDDVSDSYVYEAVLDTRTTPICRALSGRVFRYSDPNRKLPPQHVGCRSTIRALLKGIDQTITDQQVPRTMRSYETWLRTQDSTTQNGILGVTRAQWWRDGRMSLGDAIGSDARVLTLAQLRERLGLAATSLA